MKHYLKIWIEHYKDVMSGKKKAEVRFDDRNFNVGDTLVLQEYDPISLTYTGRSITKKVTHILNGGMYGIKDKYVVMSLGKSKEI